MRIVFVDVDRLVLRQPFFSRVSGRLLLFCIGGAVLYGTLFALFVADPSVLPGWPATLMVSIIAVGGAWAMWFGFFGLFFPRTVFVDKWTRVVIIKNGLALGFLPKTVTVGFDEIKSIGLVHFHLGDGVSAAPKSKHWQLLLNCFERGRVSIGNGNDKESPEAREVGETLSSYLSKPVAETSPHEIG